MGEDEYREEESASEDEQEQTEAEPARETFRQGYGSGKRRSTTGQRSYGGGRDRFRGGGYGGRDRERGFGRDRYRDREDHGPVPVEEGQELTVTIDALGRRGDGIARLNNFVIFVPGGKAGDQVKIRITTVRGSFAAGEIVS